MKQQLVDFAVLGVSAGAGVVAGRLLRRQLLDRLTFLPELAKPVIQAAAGFGAGIALQKVDRRAAAGVAAGVIGEAIGSAVSTFVPMLGASYTDEELLLGVGRDNARAALSGPSGARQFDVEDGDGGFRGFEVEETSPTLAAFVG